MGNKFKNKEICTYCFFDDMIKNFDLNKIKIAQKVAQKYFLIYYTGYVTIKDLGCIKINSVNSLYLIINKIKQ